MSCFIILYAPSWRKMKLTHQNNASDFVVFELISVVNIAYMLFFNSILSQIVTALAIDVSGWCGRYWIAP